MPFWQKKFLLNVVGTGYQRTHERQNDVSEIAEHGHCFMET